jgi:hypothetical protein
MLDADGQAHRVLCDTGFRHFIRRQLPVRRGCRMARQGLGIADVDQAREKLQRILKTGTARNPALHAEGENS